MTPTTSSVQVQHLVIDDLAREQLRQFFVEHRTHHETTNPENTAQHFFVRQWTDPDWPRAPVQAVLDQVLTQPYDVEFVFFGGGSGDGFRLHVDTQEGPDQSRNYKIVIIPIDFQGQACTVFFDNHWLGSKAKFDRLAGPGSQQGIARNITDYSALTNYDPQGRFDSQLHDQYIRHVPLENLHGLTLDQVVEWRLGSAVIFDRTQLHCAGTGHNHKIWITCFTRRAQ